MNEKMENKKDFSEKKLEIINQSEFQQFIKNQKIRPEDIILIEKLAAFPKNLVTMELHNMFNEYHEESRKELEQLIKNEQNETKKALYEAALRFCQAYGWSKSFSLVRLLEGEI